MPVCSASGFSHHILYLGSDYTPTDLLAQSHFVKWSIKLIKKLAEIALQNQFSHTKLYVKTLKHGNNITKNMGPTFF